MTPAIVNHLWQSTVIVIAAALVAFALRRNQARTRHAVWLAASLKFLLPFSLLISLGGALTWRTAEAPVTIAPTIVETVQTVTEPFAESSAGPAPANVDPAPKAIPWSAVLASVWIVGTFVVLAVRLRGWLSVRAVLRASAPATFGDVEVGLSLRAAPGLLEPGIVGIVRPVLLVPVGLDSTLSPEQLRAVVAHELHHIRRRDNLTSTLHMIVEAFFWFHPLVWWVGARLIDERERACDEYVLANGAAAEAYAEGILNVCKRYVESPVACVSGVTGSDLKKRIGAILAGRVGLELSISRKAMIALAASTALAVPVAAGVVTTPVRRASIGQTGGRSSPGARQTFDVASIRPCEGSAGTRGGGSGSPEGPRSSPDLLYLPCITPQMLIELAYVLRSNADGKSDSGFDNWPTVGLSNDDSAQRIRSGPSWMYDERFTLEAKAAGVTTVKQRDALVGPMLRSLLEDRFKLRMHQGVEQASTYAMTVANGGLKLQPMREEECTTDRSSGPTGPIAAVARSVLPTCSFNLTGPDGPNWRQQLSGLTLTRLAGLLSSDLGIKVIDQTGVKDKFLFTWVYGPDERTPGPLRRLEQVNAADPRPPTAPDIFTALRQQLGLQLDPIKSERAFLVVDHIEKPDAAAPAVSTSAPTPADKQKFDVASIRLCDNTSSVPGGRNGGSGPVFSPGLFVYNCGTLEQLINGAYVTNGDPLLNDEGRGAPGVPRDEKTFPQRIRGGPDWMRTDRFMIEAKTPVSTGESGRQAVPERAVMMGPMLRALLEDRFKMKLHRDVLDDVAMYALTVAKVGLKIKPATPDSCAPADPGRTYQMDEEIATVRKGGKPICGHGIMAGMVGANHALVFNGQTMAGVARFLSGVMDRHVLDQTGGGDKFVIYLEYAPDDQVPYDLVFLPKPTDPPTAPTMAQALKAFGLELQPTKGPKGYIVIDHVERPDFAGAEAPATSRQAPRPSRQAPTPSSASERVGESAGAKPLGSFLK